MLHKLSSRPRRESALPGGLRAASRFAGDSRNEVEPPGRSIVLYTTMSSPLPSPERVIRSLPCLCAATLTASRALSRAYSAAIRDTGLEITQFAILQLMDTLGPMTHTDLGERLAAGKTTVSRNIALMERDGLVVSEPGRDKRTKLVGPTPAGRRKLHAALPAWDAVQARVRRDMPPGTFDALIKTLPEATLTALRI